MLAEGDGAGASAGVVVRLEPDADSHTAAAQTAASVNASAIGRFIAVSLSDLKAFAGMKQPTASVSG